MKREHTHLKKVVMVAAVIIVISTTGCMLQPADDANVVFVVPQELGASGYFGDLPDVDRVAVTVRGGPADAESGEQPLLASLELSADTDWQATAADVPTMTTLTIEAIAYGYPSHSYFGEWTFESDQEQVLFTGITERMITTASAQVYISMRPYDDGSLQRLPRVKEMRSNLNELTLEIDLRGYGDSEQWYWRIIDDTAGTVAVDSFSATSGSVTFPGVAADEVETVALQYLAPTTTVIMDDPNTPEVETVEQVNWLNHLYVLEIANPQHNVLRQTFVVNPGASGSMDVNFAPWIQNITAGRYNTAALDYAGAFAMEESVVRWQADAVDEDSAESLRYVWLLDLRSSGGESFSIAFGDVNASTTPGEVATLITGIETLYSSDSPFGADRRGVSTQLLGVMAGVAAPEGTAVGDTQELPDVSGTGFGPDTFIVPGDWFDLPGVTGDLYLVVADTEFVVEVTGEQTYDDYSWSYVKMELDGTSFPALGDGTNGIIRFEE